MAITAMPMISNSTVLSVRPPNLTMVPGSIVYETLSAPASARHMFCTTSATASDTTISVNWATPRRWSGAYSLRLRTTEITAPAMPATSIAIQIFRPREFRTYATYAQAIMIGPNATLIRSVIPNCIVNATAAKARTDALTRPKPSAAMKMLIVPSGASTRRVLRARTHNQRASRLPRSAPTALPTSWRHS
jgi:hypothetical protein